MFDFSCMDFVELEDSKSSKKYMSTVGFEPRTSDRQIGTRNTTPQKSLKLKKIV